MSITERIELLIKEKNMKPSEVADSLHISRSNLTRWKQKEYVPCSEHIVALAQFFDTTTDWILTGDGQKNKANNIEPILQSDEQIKKLLSLEEQLLLAHYNGIPDNKKLEIQKNAARVALEAEAFNANSSTPSQIETLGSVSKKKIPVRVYDLPASAGFGNYLGDEEPYEVLPFAVDQVPPETEFGVRISGDSMYPKIKDGSVAWIKQQIAVENEDIGIFILDGLAYCKQLIIDHEKRVIKLVSINSNYPPLIINESNDLRTIGKVLGSSFF